MPHAIEVTLGITIISTIFLASGWIRPDLVALAILLVLGLTRLVTPDQAVAGFSSSAVITILAISVIAEGFNKTGISYNLGQFMKRVAGNDGNRLIVVVTLSGAILSLFMNNIAAMAVLLPATMSLSRGTRIPPSRLLMPLAFGVISGGMATLFTTSNIITSSALTEAGFRAFGILDFVPIGIPVIIITLIYMRFVGKNLLPERRPAGQVKNYYDMRTELMDLYKMNSSIWEVIVKPGSGMAGLSIRAGAWRTKIRLNVIGITRNGKFIPSPTSDDVIFEGDVLLTQGEPALDILELNGLKLLEKEPVSNSTQDHESPVAEIALAPHSNLAGKTLREIHFREKFHLTVLALWRLGKPIHINFASIPLRSGDGLLIQGSKDNLRMLSQERDFIFLEEDKDAIARPGKARIAGWIGLITLAIALTGWYPIAIVSLLGAIVMVLTKCLNMDEAYSAIDWKVIFLIAGIWPLSTAIISSGLSGDVIHSLQFVINSTSPIVQVSILLFLTMVLTNIMAGQAAVPIILAPIGLALAKSSGIDARMVLMAIALGSSLAFPSPLGHPVNMIVMGSGGYSFKDFLRVGLPLTVLIFITLLIGLHVFWGL